MSVAVENYLIFSAVYLLLCWAIYLPYRCGQIYLAPVYCMAVGAYFAAYSAREWSWPFAFSVAGAVLSGAFSALIPALGLRKAEGYTVAIVSMGLIFIINTIILNLDFVGGSAGFFDIPWNEHLLPITMALLVLVGVLIHRIDGSYIGRAAETLYYSRDLGTALGVSISRISVLLQVIAGAISGLAGAIYAFQVGSVFPSAFGFSLLLSLCCYLFVGGTFTMWGVVVSVPLLWGMGIILPNEISKWRDLMFGVILVVTLILRPEGAITKETISKIHRLILPMLNRISGSREVTGSRV